MLDKILFVVMRLFMITLMGAAAVYVIYGLWKLL